MSKIVWTKKDASFLAELPGNVTLVASPDKYASGFMPKPARGTKWRAQASQWEEATRTSSRFGRDIYGTLFDTPKDAMRAAEALYRETLLPSMS